MKIKTILLLLFIPEFLFAQVEISGIVVNSHNGALGGVIILQKSKVSNKLMQYCRTDIQGKFSLKITAQNSSDSYLECSLLGFKKKDIEISPKVSFYKIVMIEEAINLKEVVVKPDKVTERGDTVTYNVGRYATQNDRSISDVLARVPGFNVDKSSGKISYNGKEISKFYIEGLDMLGGRYGVATNSLPQTDVSTVQVLKNNQPIKVLKDFTYSDEVALNINMKEKAKSHWVKTFDGSMGMETPDKGLWKFEGFGLRLQSKFQSMITYKTNNIGKNIINETDDLFKDFTSSPVKDTPVTDYIKLSPSNSPSLDESRTLFNRSYALTLNTLKKIDVNSQLSVQVMYKRDNEKSDGRNYTKYYLSNGTKVIDNSKHYSSKPNALSVLLKYENNSNEKYISNSLSSDFEKDNIGITENGTNPNLQDFLSHDYKITDNLCLMKKIGKGLISFYSRNIIQSMPENLDVISGGDTIGQNLNIHYYETNTYGMGSLRWGNVCLSLACGLNGFIRHLNAMATGVPDSIGNLYGNNKFNSLDIYAKPSVEYKIKSFDFTVESLLQNVSYGYNSDNCKTKFYSSPDFNIRWNVSPKVRLSVSGGVAYNAIDYNKFYNGVILQDYQYINKGFAGDKVGKTSSLRVGMNYSDALNSLLSFFSISRSYNSDPYMRSQGFIGNYILLASVSQRANGNSLHMNWFLSKGLNFLDGVFNLNAMYTYNESKMLQDEILMPYRSKSVKINGSLGLSIGSFMKINNIISYGYNGMKIMPIDSKYSANNWMYKFIFNVPIKAWEIDFKDEYYHNEITAGNYKDFFLSDVEATYKTKRLEYSLSFTNIFNKKDYSYSVPGDLMFNYYENKIRSRQILFSLYFKI